MKRKILFLVAAMTVATAALAQPPPAGPTELAEGPGKAVVQTACANCHGIDVITNQRRSREEWTDIVSRMIGNGAQLNDEDYNPVIDYLAKHYGPPAK